MTAPTPTASDASALAQIRARRLETAQSWRDRGVNPYPYRFEPTDSAIGLKARYENLPAGEVTADPVAIAGRIMAIRNSGMFLDVQDASGRIQVVCHKDHLSDAAQMETLKWLDVGDIIGVHGVVRRTPRGELSVQASRYELLCKSLLPLPEKFHGLTDTETRYRQRYLDLIMNPESRDTLRKRAEIVRVIRRYLEDHDFLEVETPMLQTLATGAAAKPFKTHHNALDQDMVLRIAPELYLKRLVVGGLSDRVFELNRNFRNEGISPRHNPEFTMLEAYQAYADYTDMLDLVEAIIVHVADTVFGTRTLNLQGHTIFLDRPWPRLSMAQAVYETTGVDFGLVEGEDEARTAAKKLGVHVEATDGWGKCLEAVFEEKVEHTLIQPIHIVDYPLEVSPLAKAHRSAPRLVERFETRILGIEVANAFSELSDPVDQRARFEAQIQERANGDDEAHPLDEDYLNALEIGLPPTGGMGLGIDRLAMMLTNAPNIRDVILFPTLRQRD